MTNPLKTVVFWGAGATATLGMRTTVQQSRFLSTLSGRQNDRHSDPLGRRVRDALDREIGERWVSALHDLLIILGDGIENDHPLSSISENRMNAMRRNWRPGANDDAIRYRIIDLCTLYDWPALKLVIGVCPAPQKGEIQLVDLFNILDMHSQSRHGFRPKDDVFLPPLRVSAARNALKMLLSALFYVDWRRGCETENNDIRAHYDFAKALARRMQRQGLELADGDGKVDADDFHRTRDFYMGDVAFASMNYDPIALWCQFVANRDLNESPAAPHIGSPARTLKIFHDLGHFVSTSRFDKRKYRDRTPWHPMNEAAAQRLNDEDHESGDRIRMSKFLLPHGCLWWRECPNCGKLSSYVGDADESGEWELYSRTLIPPPPLKAFVESESESNPFYRRIDEDRKAWNEGAVDARACVHCDELTYAHHTPTVMQSNFKDSPPPFLEEIMRDLRVTVESADHIVLMGYSLPQDDVDYRAFFAARARHSSGLDNPVKCSVVVGREYDARWFGPSELPGIMSRMDRTQSPHTTLNAALALFDPANVRFYGAGIPQVFLDGGAVTESAVERLLNWEDR